MCGIVGLFCKSPELEPRLGELLAGMLVQLSDRGPDSAGIAVYRDPAPDGWTKLTLYAADPGFDWNAVGGEVVEVRARHGVVLLEGEAGEAEASVRARLPELRVMSAGREIEIYKEVGSPRAFAEAFRLHEFAGTHGLGHTRMATESRVTTEGSHPFSTGRDLCLVHNGSLSNHNRLRERLRREGLSFATENDTEVAAAGLDGIARGLEAEEPNYDNLYNESYETLSSLGLRALPANLLEAVGELERDEVLREALGAGRGEDYVDYYARVKRDEWFRYHEQVTAWELKEYLTRF